MFQSILFCLLLLPFLVSGKAIRRERDAITVAAFAKKLQKHSKMTEIFHSTLSGHVQVSKEAQPDGISLDSVAGAFPQVPYYGGYQGFTGADCSPSNAIVANSFVLNTCLTNLTLSEKFVCEDGILQKKTYSDTRCDADKQISDEIAPTGCLVSDDSTESTQIFPCNSTIYKWGPGKWAAVNYYDTNTCFENEVIWTYAMHFDYCFDNGDGTSYQFQGPDYILDYSTSDCTGDYSKVHAFDQSCVAHVENTDDFEYLSGMYNSLVKVSVSGASKTSVVGLGVLASLVMVFFNLWKN